MKIRAFERNIPLTPFKGSVNTNVCTNENVFINIVIIKVVDLHLFIGLILIVVTRHYQMTSAFEFIYVDAQLMYCMKDKKPYCLSPIR